MLKKKKLPVGISDFKELITQNYYFVDKSLLIKELLDSGAKVTLIPRPRRFGKTLNLSMIRYFFEKTGESNKNIFFDLKISKDPGCMEEQGKYPIIYMTFKSAKERNWNSCYKNIIKIISNEFKRHDYLLKSDLLRDSEKKEIEEIISLTADESIYKSSLRELSTYLHKYHGQKPIILIDEYDAPIHSGFVNEYYDEIIEFMRIFLSEGLKDNLDLSFSVLTGILRIAKESIFSGINNLKVCSLLNERYSDKFGLLESDVKELIDYYDLKENFGQIKGWYNGYTFWQHVVYNPWSIINFADNNGELEPYWVNTSDNLIIQELIKNGKDELKEDLELLLSNKQINKQIYENIVFPSVPLNPDVLWSFLFFSGYLTFVNKELRDDETYADLKIPNREVRSFFKNTVSNWFKEIIGISRYNKLLDSLVFGDIETFSKIFKDVVINSFSYFDVSDNEPEKFYHAFVLGMLVSLNQTHQVKSNRESGYGRYDVMIIPKDKTKIGIVIEFKKIDKEEEKDLEQAAQNALKQIEEKKYESELKDQGIKKVVKLAIVFDGKQVLVKN